MNIVQNQRRAYLAQAQDSARELAARLRAISPAERAALLASVAKHSDTPVDVTLTTEHRSDALDAALILDGDLAMDTTARWAWVIGSGCLFQIDVTQGDQHE